MKYLVSHQIRVLARCFKDYRDVWDMIPGMLHLSFKYPRLGMRELKAKWYIGNYEGIFKRLLAGLEDMKNKGKVFPRKNYRQIFEWADTLLKVLSRVDGKITGEVPAKNSDTELIEIVDLLHKRAESLTDKKNLKILSDYDLGTIENLIPIMKKFPPAIEREILLFESQRRKEKKIKDRDQELKDELKKGPIRFDQKGKDDQKGTIRFGKRDIKVYLDMDSCITDFDKAVKKKLGPKAAKGLKDGASEEDLQFMYDKIEEAGSDFWSEMEWYSKGQELWKVVKGYDPVLLSSPGKFKWAPAGKQNWVSENLPGISLFLESDKYIYAEPDAVLIDDSSSNIESWKEAGGLGILYEGDPESVKEQLKEIRKQP